MLSEFKVTAQIAVTNMDRSREFYEKKLGLKHKDLGDSAEMYECGNGTNFIIYSRDEPPKGDNTVMTFTVKNIEKLVDVMKEKGVIFEEYDNADIKTNDSIATMDKVKGAWFKDPDGNIIGLIQM